MNEAETRAEHIDPALAAAGWGFVEGSRIRREYPITLGRIEGQGRRGKALSADYVLVYRNTKLAIVEAKAWDEALTEGVAQAKNYAGKLAIRFTYASNGQAIYGIDMKEGTEGETPCYPTPDELWNLTFAEANAWRDRFAAVPFEDKGGYFQIRYSQDITIERVLEAVAAKKQRILLTLATGTGKTFIAFQIAWKLFQSRWNLSREPSRRPRILFQADRNILADQAYNAFSPFPEDAMIRIEPESIRKKGKVPKNGSLFFTIFQTFMAGNANLPIGGGEENAIQENGVPRFYFGEYPPDFFDFIVIDECHRGGANDESTWRAIQHMMVTTFWHADGTPMSAQQFMEMLFGKLPEFFKDEAELRALWSAPDTRAKLLHGLAEKGFGGDQLAEMQKIIDAEKSDLFDVLAYVAYAIPKLTREERATNAKGAISAHFNSKQQSFLDFVLSQYVKVGVQELDKEKLSPLLKLKYHNAIADAIADLGKPEEIGKVFAGFQKYLYQPAA